MHAGLPSHQHWGASGNQVDVQELASPHVAPNPTHSGATQGDTAAGPSSSGSRPLTTSQPFTIRPLSASLIEVTHSQSSPMGNGTASGNGSGAGRAAGDPLMSGTPPSAAVAVPSPPMGHVTFTYDVTEATTRVDIALVRALPWHMHRVSLHVPPVSSMDALVKLPVAVLERAPLWLFAGRAAELASMPPTDVPILLSAPLQCVVHASSSGAPGTAAWPDGVLGCLMANGAGRGGMSRSWQSLSLLPEASGHPLGALVLVWRFTHAAIASASAGGQEHGPAAAGASVLAAFPPFLPVGESHAAPALAATGEGAAMDVSGVNAQSSSQPSLPPCELVAYGVVVSNDGENSA